MRSRSNSTFHIFILFALLASLLGSALTVTSVYAAGITVNTTADELNADGDCSLREAIQAANTNSVVDACTAGSGADTITVPAGIYTLTIAGADEDANATGDLDITGSLTINGASASHTIIQAGATPGSGIDRVFDVFAASTLSISAVTIANGVCTSCNGGGINNYGTLTVTNSTFSGDSATLGGGILNTGTMTVTNSTFSGNSATDISGGSGGGIYNAGTLSLTNSTFSGNSAVYYGGGIFNNGTLTVTNSTFSGNSATNGSGGGIYNGGTLTVTNSTFSGNSNSAQYGGGISNGGTLHLKNTILANSASGGDCYNFGGDAITTNINNLIETNGPSGNMCGTPAVTSDPGLGALADNGGPTETFALLPSSPAINAGDDATCSAAPVNGLDQRGVVRPLGAHCDIGAYETTVQSSPNFVVNATADTNDSVCEYAPAGNCTLREAISAANSINGADTITVPAGIYTLAITGMGEDLNATGDLDITGSLTINGASAGTTVIQAGAAPGSGIDRVFDILGVISASINNVTIANGVCTACNGGGIYTNVGTLTVTNSTFSGNSTTYGGGLFPNGGGIYTNGGTVTVTNSTFSNNSAANGGGGGIASSGGSVNVTNSTFSNNSAASRGGGIYDVGLLTVTNSTFSGNSASEGGGIRAFNLHLKNTVLANSPSGGDCYNNNSDTIGTNMNNLIESNGPDGHMCGTPALSADPNLGTLTGSPAYFPLLSGSPAINAGNDAICAAAPVSNTSQNGLARPQGAHCDIGSFELKIYTLFLPFIRR